jgi:hypothetical protein
MINASFIQMLMTNKVIHDENQNINFIYNTPMHFAIR